MLAEIELVVADRVDVAEVEVLAVAECALHVAPLDADIAITKMNIMMITTMIMILIILVDLHPGVMDLLKILMMIMLLMEEWVVVRAAVVTQLTQHPQ